MSTERREWMELVAELRSKLAAAESRIQQLLDGASADGDTIAKLTQQTKEAEHELAELSKLRDCGHEQRFTDWEDHSKPIICTLCEIKKLCNRCPTCGGVLIPISMRVCFCMSLLNVNTFVRQVGED